MLGFSRWLSIAQYLVAAQCFETVLQSPISTSDSPDFSFSKNWAVLGPFQIGTRESPWGADPLEFLGGFRSLHYDHDAIYRSSLGFNGTISWDNATAKLSNSSPIHARAELHVGFPDIDWDFFQKVYGWAGHQWQGWARGEIKVESSQKTTMILDSGNVIEYWIDDTHYFGGDFYGLRRAPATLHLEPGVHKIDVRLVGDVRSVGGVGEPSVDIQLDLQKSWPHPRSFFDSDKLKMADVIGGDWGPMASPYASVPFRNDGDRDMFVYDIDGMHGTCMFELLEKKPIRVVPGQTRPIAFKLICIPSYQRRMYFAINYWIDGENAKQSMSISCWPDNVKSMTDPHKITFLHPGGIVSYAVLRPPLQTADCGQNKNQSLPILIALHGSNVDADSDEVKHSFDDLPDLCAWVLFPTGVTLWAGDDWHNWGFADVEAAVAAIPDWIERVEWQGPGVDVDRWLIAGHSNGGQGVYYALTHRPDKLIGAAALSGYSSITNYVPYLSWQTTEPRKKWIVESSLLSYQHDLLVKNAADVPIIIQHGSKDTNVPAYHSRLMNERFQESGVDSTYFEVPGKPHYWSNVLTTQPLREFYKKQLGISKSRSNTPINMREFRVVVANPGDLGSKNGVKVLELALPGQLGSVDFSFDPTTGGCLYHTSNVLSVQIPSSLEPCDYLMVDGKNLTLSEDAPPYVVLHKDLGIWNILEQTNGEVDTLNRRIGRQLGYMDAIFRTHGAFSIVEHSKGVTDIALQISRNLCQYLAADTDITDDYNKALESDGNVISVAIGSDLPDVPGSYHPILPSDGSISIRDTDDPDIYTVYNTDNGMGLAAIFLRPLPHERLELVVWAESHEYLDIAARLVPMMTGSGQPDFVIGDKSMRWKGLQGTLALGFYDSAWNISVNSFFT